MKLSAGRALAEWNPTRGARLVSLRPFGDERDLVALLSLDGVPDEIVGGCFPMAPYAGRVRHGEFEFRERHVSVPVTLDGHAIHGLVHDRPWRVTGPTTLRRDLDRRWPYGGDTTLEVALGTTSLTMRLTYRAGPEPTPATIGFHPWFPRTVATGQPVQMAFAAAAKYARGADGTPTGNMVSLGEGPWDDCFASPEWPVTLTWPGACRLAIYSDASHLVVFDELDSALCIEPQTGPPNEVNLGHGRTLRAGEALSIGMRWEWEDLSHEGRGSGLSSL